MLILSFSLVPTQHERTLVFFFYDVIPPLPVHIQPMLCGVSNSSTINFFVSPDT